MKKKNPLKSRFLCYQQMVMKEEIVGTTNNIKIDVVIRNIGAKSESEAIGKFTLATNEIEAQKKLNPICFPLDNLIKIDMEQKTNKLAQFVQWILSIVIGFFDLSFVGFFIILASFEIFGETEMWSWQMWLEIIGVSIGGTVLIQYGKNCR